MIDKALLLEKIDNVQRCLKRMEQVTKLDPASLEDLNTQDIFVLNLQRSVLHVLEIAEQIVRERKLGEPDELVDDFTKIHKHGLISENLCEAMSQLSGFKNIAVQDYRTIDLRTLKYILTHHIMNFREFTDFARTLLK